MRWSEAKTIKFVKLYRDHECLWNSTISDYRNKTIREGAYRSLVEQMDLEDFTVADVRQKIKNLRNTYKQELGKINKSIEAGNRGAAVYVPALKWFKTMDSIISSLKDKNEIETNIVRDPFVSMTFVGKSEQAFPAAEDLLAEEEEEYQESGTFSETPSTSGQPQTTYILTKETVQQPTQGSNKKRRLDLTSIIQDLKHINGSIEDDFDAYGRYISLSLKQLPLHLALEAQNELQRVLTKYRLIHANASEPETYNSFQSANITTE